MTKRILAAAVAAVFALASCGGGSSSKQDEVADLLLKEAEKEGVKLDESCVKSVTAKLSDEDAKKLVEAGVDGDPDISADGDAIAAEIFRCVDTDSIVDQMVKEFEEQFGEGSVDKDCLRKVFKDLDITDLDNIDDDAFLGVTECITMGD